VTEAPLVWQRVPQGWIELVAFDDDEIAEKWWQRYLASGEGIVDESVRAAMTTMFHGARSALRGSPYAIAGLLPYVHDEPTVFFLGTTVLPAAADGRATRAAGSLAGLVRFGDEMRTETFVALDGRAGSASLGVATTDDGTAVAAITGEVPLPGDSGTVFVLALSLDPERLDELAPYAALALDSTILLTPGQQPPAYPPAAASDAERAECSA